MTNDISSSSDTGPYEEAAKVLTSAASMFGNHTQAITGNRWDFEAAGAEVRTIWIIKAVKERIAHATELPEIPDDDSDFTPALARKIVAKYQAIIGMRNSEIDDLKLGPAQRPAQSPSGGVAEALTKLIRTAQLLQQNSEGCAVNHHEIDFAEQGLPGWLLDTQKSIDEAIAALSSVRVDAWQPISSAPRDRDILAIRADWWTPVNGNHRWIFSKIRSTKWIPELECFDFGCEKQPTHWMPAPPMPEDLSDGHLNAGDGE